MSEFRPLNQNLVQQLTDIMPQPKHLVTSLQQIVSGGQTGVDRAALDVAIALGIAHGGWCPLGRLAEDGRIAEQYQLQELDSSDYSQRTRRNVLDSDGTLILHELPLAGGTFLTWRTCEQLHKPVLIIRLRYPGPDRRFHQWIAKHKIGTLNIAGPRASKEPKIYDATVAYLSRVLSHPSVARSMNQLTAATVSRNST